MPPLLNLDKLQIMPYVELEDYVITVSAVELDDVLTQAANEFGLTNDEAREKYEKLAESKIRMFLSAKYDLDAEFVKVGDNRNLTLVEVYLNLVCPVSYQSSPCNSGSQLRNGSGVSYHIYGCTNRHSSQPLTHVQPKAILLEMNI